MKRKLKITLALLTMVVLLTSISASAMADWDSNVVCSGDNVQLTTRPFFWPGRQLSPMLRWTGLFYPPDIP